MPLEVRASEGLHNRSATEPSIADSFECISRYQHYETALLEYMEVEANRVGLLRTVEAKFAARIIRVGTMDLTPQARQELLANELLTLHSATTLLWHRCIRAISKRARKFLRDYRIVDQCRSKFAAIASAPSFMYYESKLQKEFDRAAVLQSYNPSLHDHSDGSWATSFRDFQECHSALKVLCVEMSDLIQTAVRERRDRRKLAIDKQRLVLAFAGGGAVTFLLKWEAIVSAVQSMITGVL